MEHREPFYAQIAENIKQHGRQVLAVAGDRKHKAFAYTIGNHSKLLPELLLIGPFGTRSTQAILNWLSEKMVLNRKPFLDGEHANVGGEYDLIIYDTVDQAKKDYTNQATQFYGHANYSVQQVLMPDPNGRYPTGKVCHKHYRVPVLRPIAALMKTVQSTQVH